MHIKEIKTKNRKTNKEYVKHTLVESIRTENGPRHRTVMQLGKLKLDKTQWSILIAEIESRLTGQDFLNIPGIKTPVKVRNIADKVFRNLTIKSEKRVEKLKVPEGSEVIVDLEKMATTKHRSFGGEYVALSTWNELKLTETLKLLGFSTRERSLAQAVVVARLISPDSELSTCNWIKNTSSIGEITEEPLDNLGLNSLYNIGDKLLENKIELEKHLTQIEAKLHPGRETVYLFDLTNFYFEGQALGNSLARHGKSKENRKDCPLVSLALVVDADGFPISSEVYPGNISEPHTFEEMLKKLKCDEYLPGMAPALVMDRGIATKENIDLLKARNLSYVLITRGPRNEHYLSEFENPTEENGFRTLKKNNREIKIKEVKDPQEDIVEILCVSEGKKEKERAILLKWTEHASTDLASLQKRIRNGHLTKTEKILKKLGRFEERYAGLNKYFDIELIKSPSKVDLCTDIIFSEKAVFDIDEVADTPLLGSYVIETTLREKTPEEIWSIYMTLTKVEEAFKCLKSDLGTRPIYHQNAQRTRGHLFISILAYHLLANIEYKLSLAGDSRRWSTICKVLTTHQRSTTIMVDDKNQIHHIRSSSQAELCHWEIYRALRLKPGREMKKHIVAKRL